MAVPVWIETALRRLHKDGLLLESDRQLPSVITIVAGEPFHGSWWGNPAARGTYEVLVGFQRDRRTAIVSGRWR